MIEKELNEFDIIEEITNRFEKYLEDAKKRIGSGKHFDHIIEYRCWKRALEDIEEIKEKYRR